MISRIKNKLFGIASRQLSEFDKLYYDYKDAPRFKHNTVSFRNYVLETPDTPSVIWQIKEIFIDESLKFQSKQEVPVIIDCGANVGLSVLYFRQTFPKARIIAFEADAKIAGYTEKNLLRNNAPNVEIVKKAVWVHNDGVVFGSEGADGGSIYFPSNHNTIPSVRLRDELEKQEYVSLLKIDIEGAETEVLKDCSDQLYKVEFLFVEYHSWVNQPQNLSELLQVLESNGFRYSVISHGNDQGFSFVTTNPENHMDSQLNIYAVNQRIKK